MKVVDAARRQEWPNFFIVGSARAGTTTLYEILRHVPGVYMSPFKEPEFFAPNSPTHKYGRHYSDEDNYLKLFEKAGNAVAVGEASTAYLWDTEAPVSIHKKLPHAKIIGILRNPVERAYSDYSQDVYLRNIKVTFEEALRQEASNSYKAEGTQLLEEPFSYIRNGFYSPNVKKYLSLFGERQVKIIIFEEYVRNTKDKVNEILEFLDISYRVQGEINEKHNSSLQPRKGLATSVTSAVHTSRLTKVYHRLPYGLQSSIADGYRAIERSLLLKSKDKQQMSSDARTFLKETFVDEVRQLEDILKRKLPWQDFKN